MTTIRRYNHGYLNTTPTAIARAEVGPITIESIWICNTGGSNDTFSLYHVPAGEAQSDEHALYKDSVIRSKITQVVETHLHLSAGEALWAEATTGGVVTMTLYEAYD